MKLLSIFVFKLSLLFLFSLHVQAKDIVIGASLNLSGVNAQYSIDYKNAIESYFESYNKLDKLKKYQLKLLVLDDQGAASRARANIERLINRKQVIAVLNPYQGQVGEVIIRTSVNLETLVLSSTFMSQEAVETKAEKRYSYYFSTQGFLSHQVVNQFFEQAPQSKEKLFYFTDEQVIERIETIDNPVELYIDNPLTELPVAATIVVEDSYVDGASFINDAVKSRPDLHFIIKPNIGADALIPLLGKGSVKNISFIVDVPVHQQQLPLLIDTGDVIRKYNEKNIINSQSLKGMLTATIIAESVFHVVNTLQAESLAEVINLPFQVLERMVGWIKHSTSDLDRELLIDEIRSLKSFDVGLEQTISHNNNGLGLDELWILEVNNGLLVLRGKE